MAFKKRCHTWWSSYFSGLWDNLLLFLWLFVGHFVRFLAIFLNVFPGFLILSYWPGQGLSKKA